MPYVKRDNHGAIVAVSASAEDGFSEHIDVRDKELNHYLAQLSSDHLTSDHQSMTETDLDFVRVVEDLVELLIAKNYILFTELPEKAQEKMRKRQAMRGKLGEHLDLLADDDEGFL